MHQINCLHQISAQPWNISFSKRLEILCEYISSRKKINLLLYEQADTSTFRYRAYNIYTASQRCDTWRCVYFFKDEITHLETYLRHICLVTVIRFRWNFALDRFIQIARNMGIQIMFDIDDLVFDLNYLPMITNTLNVNMKNENEYDFWFAYVSRLEFTARKADGFITSNAFLGKKMQERFDKPFFIIPNFINDEQIQISEICNALKGHLKSQSPFTIGYFSGTPSHVNDFGVVSSEIIQLLNDYKDIHLKVVGFMEFPNTMKPYIKNKQVEFTPLVDFIELQRLIAEVDVNIAPLYQNTFTECKSELKFFEAAIVNTVTCATPTYTFVNSIQDGVTGYLCRQGEWYSRLEMIYKKTSELDELTKKANEYCLNRYYGNTIYNQIETSYELAFMKNQGVNVDEKHT